MGFINFTNILAKFFNVLSWPSIVLVYPLCASIRAIESDKEFGYQRCLKYWVLFSMTLILEWTITLVLPWLPFWPYAKGTAFVVLAVPYFGGASYVYKQYIQPYVTLDSCACDALNIATERDDLCIKQSNVLEEGQGEIRKHYREESENVVICEGNLAPCTRTTESPVTALASPRRVQREQRCGLSPVGFSGDKCLAKHFLKHNSEQEELRTIEVKESETVIHSRRTMRSHGMVLVESFNQITRANFGRLSSLISPNTRPAKWCTWKKPDIGWTKLNTDGSIDRVNAGIGGLLRDCKGDPICGYVSKASADDIFLVELWAIWRGLVLALGLGIKVLWVESDSMSVVKTINKEQQYGPKAASCLKSIWKLLQKFEKYKVSHSWRESNRAADHLSKMDHQGNDDVLWPVDFPKNLCKIIEDDAQGRWYRRGHVCC